MSAEFRKLHYSNKGGHKERSDYWKVQRLVKDTDYSSRSREVLISQNNSVQAELTRVLVFSGKTGPQTKP